MEEVIRKFKEKFEKDERFSVNIPKGNPDYCWEKIRIQRLRIGYAAGCMQTTDKITKDQALQIIMDILDGKI